MSDDYAEKVIKPNDKASRLAHEINMASHRNCPAVKIVPHEPGNFRGAVGFLWNKHVLAEMAKAKYDSKTGEVTEWVMLEEAETDGAGGKPQLCTLVGTEEAFLLLPWEVITMTKDDFGRTGRHACIIVNEVEMPRITDANFHLVQAVFRGFGDACKEAKLVSLTGETAIMVFSVTAFCDLHADDQLVMNWGATCLGLAHRDKLLDPRRIKAGMPIVAFWDHGYRCNGGTTLDNILMYVYGPETEKILQNMEAMDFARRLAVPSISYANLLDQIIGWHDDGMVYDTKIRIAGIAHITGGGVWGKFGEILPEGVGADLNDMMDPAQVLLDAQRLSLNTPHSVSDWKGYGTLCGGTGMMVVPETDADARAVCELAKRAGIRAEIVGHTVASADREIVIASRFLQKPGKSLSSLHPE